MSLTEKLQELRESAKERIPEEIRALMQKATADLRDSGITDSALRAGDSLPPFELPSVSGGMVSSLDLLAKGRLVLTLYRGVW